MKQPVKQAILKRRTLLFCIVLWAIAALVALLPSIRNTKAAIGGSALTQQTENLKGNGTPSLAGMLQADGSLLPGIEGSFNASEYRMEYGAKGEPRFVQAIGGKPKAASLSPQTVPDDVYWDARFGTLGTNGQVSVIVVSGSNVYLGGRFNLVGGINANNIAKWNGSSWSALGSGVNYVVYAIAVSGSDLYVGGQFTSAGGVSAKRIAKWNGSSWSSLGSDLDNNYGIYAIAVSGSDVYVGGNFTSIGGVNANFIAKWSGSSWSALGSGLGDILFGGPPPVSALAVSGSNVYVGGGFASAGGVSANKIAKWNGASWSALGNGIVSGGYPYALATSGSDVYVGGTFTSAGEVSASRIAKWNGSSWSSLGSGVSGVFDSPVYALAVSGSDLYVGGQFTMAGGVNTNNIAKWNGSSWSALGNGLTGVQTNVWAIVVTGSDVYVGGDLFSIPGGANATNIAKWNGSSWSALGSGVANGLDFVANDIAMSGSDVYVGGNFIRAGGVSARGIAKWNGSSWSALGSGLGSINNNFNFANSIAVSGSDVYVAGGFDSAGGVSANNIAKWNGSTWSALGSGSDYVVDAIAVSGSDVYVGGNFANVGGVSANRIAKWNGSSWSALGSGVSGGLFTVQAITVNGNDVYVGGELDTAGGVSVNHIARWNGSSWFALGSGVSGDPYPGVYAITVSGSNVYVGGSFTSAGGMSADNIAKWNGSNWSALGGGVSGPFFPRVFKIAVSGSDVYVGGRFTLASGVSANNVAKWNGSNWSALGSGMSGGIYGGQDDIGDVFAIAVNGSDVYVGGQFNTAGGKPSLYFARYSVPTTITPSSQSFSAAGGNGSVNVIAQGSWTAISNDPSWVTITSGGGGNGNGTVTFSVALHSGASPRSTTLTINNDTFTVFQGAAFLDVPVGHPFYNEIGKLSARGVTLGCGNGNYCPNDSVTREQMAAFIMRANGEFSPPPPASQRFNDVPPSNVFYSFIDRLAVLQITLGCTPDHLMYCPSDPVRREQMAAFLMRGLGEFNPPTPGSQRFGDVPPANIFYNFIDRLAVLNITLGCTPDHLMYCPGDSVTRAQMAAFLVRAFNL